MRKLIGKEKLSNSRILSAESQPKKPKKPFFLTSFLLAPLKDRSTKQNFFLASCLVNSQV